jgi:hypothetical protein
VKKGIVYIDVGVRNWSTDEEAGKEEIEDEGCRSKRGNIFYYSKVQYLTR